MQHRIKKIIIASACSLITGCTLTLLILFFALPDPLPTPFPPPCSTKILDRNGKLLRLFTTKDGYWRLPAHLEKKGDNTVVDPEFIRLLLACEDKRFWSHHGVDLLALSRAFFQLITQGRVVSGASTITMQTVRLLCPHSRSVWGKIFEMIQALRLEQQLSKEKILETYLTLTPYGGNIEGIEAACRFYFQKNAARITPSQAALLISLPQSPEQRRPDRHHQRAVAARNRFLHRLYSEGLLTAEQVQLGLQQPVPQKRSPTPFLAPHLSQRLYADMPGQENIRTSLSKPLQQQLETIAHQAQDRLSKDRRKTLALLVVANQGRKILAHIGSGDFWSNRIDLTRARRSPGSTLKPFIYGLAFEQGFLHPETRILDRPTRFGSYGPGNFDGYYQGWVAIREALHRSLNLPAVQVLERVGPQRFMSRFARLGLAVDPNKSPGLSLALGGTAASLMELTALYAALADQGTYRSLSFRPNVQIPFGKKMLSKAAAWYVDDILRTRPPRSGVIPKGLQGHTVRYKTGTSYGYRDAWALGYTPNHTVGVWIGRPDWGYGKETTGANSAVPILFRVFAALRTIPELRQEANQLPVQKPAQIPAQVLRVRHNKLPLPLQWFSRTAGPKQQVNRPVIYFPVNGSTMQLAHQPLLALKSHGGIPPFHWLINGRPLARKHQEAITSYSPQGPGLTEITLIDSQGKRDTVSVWLTEEESHL
ncbi:MAG: penicillin-binding protein 1C [Candidatus Electrothrix sp. AW1]|nr:penicillin-binding protein 1C [Candidatus Electrothrix sp. AX1]MCI5180922.1 penicillin-binding protein 1C [Candidatus Electrothrix gigas]